MWSRLAFNVKTNTLQAIDDLDDATKFVTHKPRLPPYQAPDFKSRVLWVHTSAGYVVWMTGGKLLLVSDSAVPQGDNDTHALAVGEFINDYIFDKATHATSLATYKGSLAKRAASNATAAHPPSKKAKNHPNQTAVPEVAPISYKMIKKMRRDKLEDLIRQNNFVFDSPASGYKKDMLVELVARKLGVCT